MIEFIAVLIGLVFGSFIPVYAESVYQNKLPLGRSRCDHCGTQLRPASLIPVFSWLYQGGKSSCCHKPLTPRYVFVELFTACVSVLVAHYSIQNGLSYVIMSLILALSMVAILFADGMYHLIPDSALIVATVGVIGMFGLSNALDALVLFGVLYALYKATHGKGIGFGDVKFMIPFGLLLGLQDGLLALYIAVVLGGLWGIVLIATGKKGMKSTIAFGPFLIAGLVIMYVWGEQVWKLVRMV